MPLGTKGVRGAESGVKITHLCVPAVAAVEEGGRRCRRGGCGVLHYRADTSATKFAPAGLAWPFGARSPLLDLNTRMMHIFSQKKTKR